MSEPADVQAAFAATLVDEWVRSGVVAAVVAPGSRSTPILAALAADGRLPVQVVLDERAAGFRALGIGLATGWPAVVVTTSGTAAVELHPAVVEAHQAGVPLLVVTADRPPELHRVGAPQTAEQAGLYPGVLRFDADPGVAVAETAGSWRSLAARAVAETRCSPRGPGPVQLNLAFREPLLAASPSAAAELVPPGRSDGQPWHRVDRRAGLAPPQALVNLLVNAGERGVIVAGAGAAGSAGDAGAGAAGSAGDAGAVLGLARRLGWPLLADPRSGCRWPDPVVVAAADGILRAGPWAALRPDVVVRLGRPWASKVVSAWLAGLGPTTTQVLLDPSGSWADPERTAGWVVAADAGPLARAVLSVTGSDRSSVWSKSWSAAEAAAQEVLERALAGEDAGGTGLSEPALARTVLASVPAGSMLVASSSMPVRDLEWFGAPRADVTVLANRGVNGIDGVVSTVLGVGSATARPTIGLVGDLAFLYDAGALLDTREYQGAVTLVVIDNDGGGIFSFLPQADALAPDIFERYWGTPHRRDLCALATAYGIDSQRVRDATELRAVLADAARPGVRVLVVPGEREANVERHRRLDELVAGAVARLAPG